MAIYIDISNYVETRAHTGIQRVVREFLYRLAEHEEFGKTYKVAFFDGAVKAYRLLLKTSLLDFLNNSKEYVFSEDLAVFAIDEIKHGDIFYDMDGCWNHNLKRTYLYRTLKENGAKIYNFIYDLVPIKKPKFSHNNTTRNFITYIYAVLQYSDLVMFDSRSAEKDFFEVKSAVKNTRNISSKVVKLGSHIFEPENGKLVESVGGILNSKYLLFVGTLEPRKNQRLALDAFEKLAILYPDLNLVFVGRKGWNNDEFISRVESHPLLNKQLFWLQNIDDYNLNQLYKNAFICLYLSEYEGFGLPIAESLGIGKITITSNNSSMYEVGKEFADYLDYNAENECFDIVKTYIENPALYQKKQEHITQHYNVYTWEQFYTNLLDALSNNDKTIPKVDKLQFVFISIDAENIKRTISKIDDFVDFVDSYVIVTAERFLNDFKQIKSKHKITLINEQDILPVDYEEFRKLDHSSKNWMLRSSLINSDIIQDVFVMLDDDNVPLKPIDITNFITQDGRYCGYYYYDMLDWNNRLTDYDFCQIYTRKLLDEDGLELLSYSSHRPQIIDKEIFKEVVDKYAQIGFGNPIDEWNIYFNYGVSKYPHLFVKKVFDVLNWPGMPSDWNLSYIPTEYNFENYYAHLYDERKLFLSNADATLDEKLTRRSELLKPYLATKELMDKNRTVLSHLNMVHGVLSFAQPDGQGILHISNMPYYIEAVQGCWVRLSLNYKAQEITNNILVTYYINGDNGHKNSLTISNRNYDEGKFDFAISCVDLPPNVYDLYIDVIFNDEKVYGIEKSPYLIKLQVQPNK